MSDRENLDMLSAMVSALHRIASDSKLEHFAREYRGIAMHIERTLPTFERMITGIPYRCVGGCGVKSWSPLGAFDANVCGPCYNLKGVRSTEEKR